MLPQIKLLPFFISAATVNSCSSAEMLAVVFTQVFILVLCSMYHGNVLQAILTSETVNEIDDSRLKFFFFFFF